MHTNSKYISEVLITCSTEGMYEELHLENLLEFKFIYGVFIFHLSEHSISSVIALANIVMCDEFHYIL
jgi:hypothetical protein